MMINFNVEISKINRDITKEELLLSETIRGTITYTPITVYYKYIDPNDGEPKRFSTCEDNYPYDCLVKYPNSGIENFAESSVILKRTIAPSTIDIDKSISIQKLNILISPGDIIQLKWCYYDPNEHDNVHYISTEYTVLGSIEHRLDNRVIKIIYIKNRNGMNEFGIDIIDFSKRLINVNNNQISGNIEKQMQYAFEKQTPNRH